MTTWILIIFIGLGGSAGQSVAIQGIPNYYECDRISGEIYKTAYETNGNNKWAAYSFKSKCIEVYK